ncbi:hypothetical protein JCM6882_008170 [Rhodosporidiobolus microsporus]
MASWDLSPLYRHSQSLVLPDSTRVVSFHNSRVVLRALSTLQILRTWQLSPPPAPSSTSASRAAPAPPLAELTSFVVAHNAPYYVLCYSAKARTAWVLHPDQDEVVARIEVGNEGAVRMDWAQVQSTGNGVYEGDSRAEAVVMAWSAHHLRLSLFRIPNSSNSPALHIHNPKHTHSSGHSFHPERTFLAVLERHNGRDIIGIYSTKGEWALARSITLPDPSSDLAGLKWSSCGRYIAAWSHVTDYTVQFYLPTGHHLSTFLPYSSLSSPAAATQPSASRPAKSVRKASGGAMAKQTEQEKQEKELNEEDRKREERSTGGYVGLGVRCVEWHPSGEFVAVGGYDGRVRLLTRHGFVPIAELSVPQRVGAPTVLWKEPLGWVEKTRGKGIVSFERVTTLPYAVNLVAPNPALPNPKMGFSRLVWSPSGEWLVGMNQSYPTALALFSFPLNALTSTESTPPSPASSSFPSSRPSLHTLLLFNSPARDFAWQPRRAGQGSDGETLVAVSGEKAFAVWRTPVGDAAGDAEGVGVPAGQADFPLSTLTFSPLGDSLLLSSPPVLAAPNTSSTAAGTKEKREKDAAAGAGASGGMFCVAYPVGEEGEFSLAGGEEGRTWMEEEGAEEEGW